MIRIDGLARKRAWTSGERIKQKRRGAGQNGTEWKGTSSYRILLNPAGGGPQFVRVIYDKPETESENERDEGIERTAGREEARKDESGTGGGAPPPPVEGRRREQ